MSAVETGHQEDLRVNTGYKDIMRMALPITLAMLVPQINFLTNSIFLSGLGEHSLASAGLAGVYYLIFAVIGSGLSNGTQVLFARKAGENKHEGIGALFYNGSWVAFAFSAAGIIITYTFGPDILRSTVHDSATAETVISFLKIRIWGLPFLYLYGLRNSLLVGTGKTKLLMWGTFTEALANIFLDYTLIYGKLGFPELGFNGAAIASIIAECAGLAVVIFVIRLNKLNLQFSMRDSRIADFAVMRTIIFQSTPLILQYAISIITWEYFYILIEHHGSRALAVSNAMRNTFGISGIFAWAFAATTNTMVSNLIGQKRQEEVVPLIHKIVLISLACCLPLIGLLNLKPEIFLSFYGLGQDFIDYAIPVVRVVSVALALMSFSCIWLNAVVGTGNTVVNLVIEIITIIVYIIYNYIVLEVLFMSVAWGWASEIVYWICMFTMAYFYIRSGRWKKNEAI